MIRMNLMRATVALVMVGGSLIFAQTPPTGPGAGGGRADKADKDELPKFEDVTKDMEVSEGFFTLYYNKKNDTLLGRIPKSLLNEPFLLSVSIPKGPTFASWMMGSAAVYWERHNNKLLLMESETGHVKDKTGTVEDVVRRTYTDTIIKAIDVKTENGGDPVIDFGDLMKSDVIGMEAIYGRRRLDSSLSRWSTRKAFPDNVELCVDTALMGENGGVIAGVFFSMSRLPKNDYHPREADDRIGYFLTVQKDWSRDHTEKTVFKRYVNRWNLQKQDPELALSPVKEPIIFYIEKTVPIPYRRYVREGILEWNKAFEQIGFSDAVQTRQQTDTNEFKDLDPEDVRYNFFRWIVTGNAFAMGPSHVNPFTGEILDADIVFDDSMARFYVNEFQFQGPRGYESLSDPLADELLAQYPELEYVSPRDLLTPAFHDPLQLNSQDASVSPARLVRSHLDSHCELATGMSQQLAFSQLAHSSAGGRELPEEFIGQVIKEVVMHEVGHTLGLRHNFKASSWRPLGEIIGSRDGSEALSGSVMDYNGAEYSPDAEGQGDFITRTLGPYDMWAIEYGYRPFKSGGELKTEAEMLTAIAKRSGEPGLAYATDEDTSDFGPDPFVYRFDNGSDPVAFAKQRMELVETIKSDLVERSVEDGESYARLRRGFDIMLGEYAFAVRVAARMIGGQSVSRSHKGDPDAPEPFTIVDASAQREALDFLGKTVLSDDPYRFPPDLLTKLSPGRYFHWDSDELHFDIDYDVHDRVLMIQARVLMQLMNPMTVNRIHDAELKVTSESDAFTVHDLLSGLSSRIWSELGESGSRGTWTNRQPRISSFRRNLQREHLRRLTDIVLGGSGRGSNADVHAVARLVMKDLKRQIDTLSEQSRKDLDTYTLAHLDDSSHRIGKVLDAEFTNGGSPTSRGGIRIMMGMEESNDRTKTTESRDADRAPVSWLSRHRR